jgi:uncharacterized protein involved in type VI secretion and phage assembly
MEVRLEPELSVMRGAVRSRISLNMTGPEAVRDALKESGIGAAGFRFETDGSYPRREFAFQHGEDTLDFVMRALERDGVSLSFDQSGDREVAVFRDSNRRFPRLRGRGAQGFVARVSGIPESGGGEGAFGLYDLSAESRTPLSSVRLRDYDWKNPNRALQAVARVSADGSGESYLYGENFQSEAEGKRLAGVRREEELWDCERLTAMTRLPGLVPGVSLSVKGAGARDGDYLVSGCEFSGSQTGRVSSGLGLDAAALAAVGSAAGGVAAGAFGEGAAVSGGDGSGGAARAGAGAGAVGAGDGLRARVAFGRLDLAYRPRRATPKPGFPGRATAWVDGAGTGENPELDAYGRYRLVFASDASGRSGGAASHWIRMSQPYVGAGYGQHFPLTPGAEVLVAFEEGDPDRPVVTGAVPNAETGTLVNSTCPEQSGVGTRGGGSLLFGEKAGKQSVVLSAGSGRGHVTIAAGSPTAAEFTADMGGDNAVFNNCNAIFSSTMGAGYAWGIQATDGWGDKLTLGMAAIRQALELAGDSAGVSADGGDQNADLVSNIAVTADLFAEPIQEIMCFAHDWLDSREEEAKALLEGKGDIDEPLWSLKGDGEGAAAMWKSKETYSFSTWTAWLTLFLLAMNPVRDAAGQADGWKDYEGEDKGADTGAVKRASFARALAAPIGKALVDLVTVFAAIKELVTSSNDPATGFAVSSEESYVAMLSEGHAAFSSKGALILESSGGRRLADDLRYGDLRGAAGWDGLLTDADGKGPGSSMDEADGVLLRGRLIRTFADTVSLNGLEAAALKSGGSVRLAAGPGKPVVPADVPLSAAAALAGRMVVLEEGPDLGQGVAVEVLEGSGQGSAARMCSFDDAGAVLLLHGPHTAADAAPGRPDDRRLELSSGGALVRDAAERYLELKKDGGSAELSGGGGAKLTLASSKIVLGNGNGGVTVTSQCSVSGAAGVSAAVSGNAKLSMGAAAFTLDVPNNATLKAGIVLKLD